MVLALSVLVAGRLVLLLRCVYLLLFVIPAKAGIQRLRPCSSSRRKAGPGDHAWLEAKSFRPLRGRVTFFAGTKKITKEMPSRDVRNAHANPVTMGFSDSPSWLGRKMPCIHARPPAGLQVAWMRVIQKQGQRQLPDD